MNKLAIITGANRGLGKATAQELAKQGYDVIITGRDEAKIHSTGDELKQKNPDWRIFSFPMDVVNWEQVQKLRKFVEDQWSCVDVIINNAGVFNGATANANTSISPTLGSTDFITIEETFDINTLGPLRMIKTFWDLLIKSENANIVNVSSGMGQLKDMDGGYPAYRISKTALNSITAFTAQELQGTNVKINSVCPGWVRTDMGGAHAHRDLEEGISGIIWAATLPQDGPTGGFFRDGKPIEW